MWVSKKKWDRLEKRVSDLEEQRQGRTDRSKTPIKKIKANPHDTFLQECIDLAMRYHCKLETVKDDHDILVQQGGGERNEKDHGHR